MEYSLKRQQDFFRSGVTRAAVWRKEQLRKLSTAIDKFEPELYNAFQKDLHKSEFETFSSEIGVTKRSIAYTLRHLNRWVRPHRKRTPFIFFGSSSYTVYEPYGSVFIIGPFNYPFFTLIDPLVGAIAAGNTVLLKPSEQTPHVSEVIVRLIRSTFSADYVDIVEGEAEVTSALLDLPFDLIFFTGSTRVGKIVMEKAAKHLTPVVMELGGKSPAIVGADADMELAAKRIMWGRLQNAGQLCVAPDYCLVHESVKEKFVDSCKRAIRKMYGEDVKRSPDYGRIVSERYAERLRSMIEAHRSDIVYGGSSDGRYVEPTILSLKEPTGPAMEEEIFGPILPILSFSKREEIYEIVGKFSKPLALYVFGKDRRFTDAILRNLSSGGAMVNNVVLHVGNEHLPFGGVGDSGIGRYHGRYSMEAFSHEKAVMKTWLHSSDSFASPPYDGKILSLIRKLMK